MSEKRISKEEMASRIVHREGVGAPSIMHTKCGEPIVTGTWLSDVAADINCAGCK